jgi:hypothetical protein
LLDDGPIERTHCAHARTIGTSERKHLPYREGF